MPGLISNLHRSTSEVPVFEGKKLVGGLLRELCCKICPSESEMWNKL